MKALIKDIIIALVIVLIITAIVKPTIVRESSMEPTLYDGNYVLVNKMAYKFGKVHRGDIIVFHSDMKAEDGNVDSNGNKHLINRIIAIHGDTIKIEGGKVYLNGELQEEDYIAPGGTPGEVDETTVPEGKLFVMGDHRLVSIDSRLNEVGLVDQDRVIGDAFVRLWPLSEICLL